MEENRKGPGIFYAVVGVATLVVAIVGATFAYFSAAASATGANITGQTNDDLASALSVAVERVSYSGTTAASPNLVPTNLNGTDATKLTVGLAAKCEASGYTACHVYRITANSKQALSNVNVTLDSLTTTATVKSDWKYSIYTGSESEAESIVSSGEMNLAQKDDMHKNAAMEANKDYVYYLVIYLAEDNAEQNKGDANDAKGTYTGTVSMAALGGRVTATFASQG